MLTAPATRRSARSHQTQLGTSEDSSGVPSAPSAASAVALEVGLSDSVGASVGASVGDSLGDSLGDSVSCSVLRVAVGDAGADEEIDGLVGADVTAGADAVRVAVSRSPSDRVGLGTLGVLVALAVTEAVTLGVGRSPPPSPPHAASRKNTHAAAPTLTP